MTPGSLADPLARLERADEHVAALRRAAREYLASDPYEIYDEQIARDTRVLRVRIRQAPPRRLGIMFGDAIHAMRAALDNLAHQLVLDAGGSPTRQTGFPIFKHPVDFEKRRRRKLPGVSADVAGRIERVQPFPWRATARVRALAEVEALDVEDKHRKINACFGAPSRRVLPIGLRREPLESEFLCEVELTGYGRPLSDGGEFARLTFTAAEPQPEVTLNGKIALELGFGERGVALAALPTIAMHVRGVIEGFTGHLSSA
jgi:hypothetical protein